MENKIKLHDKVFKPFIPNQQIEKAIDAIADRINAEFGFPAARVAGKLHFQVCQLH